MSTHVFFGSEHANPRTTSARLSSGGTARRVCAVFPVAACLPLLFVVAAPVASQSVHGRVVDRTTGAPVAGAYVAALRDSVTVGQAWTDSAGDFLVEVDETGPIQLRATRLGYRDGTSKMLDVGADERVRYTFRLTPVPVVLPSITVSGGRRCAVGRESGAETARLWRAARQALEDVQGSHGGANRFERVAFQRDLDPSTLVTRREQRSRGVFTSDNPVRSAPARILADSGFVRRQEHGGWLFYAPDAEVLLSDAFLEGHCFLVDQPSSDGRIALRFWPVRQGGYDIRGTFWLDASMVLQSVEFRYTRLPEGLHDDRVGGSVELGRVGGSPFVRSWSIRTPLLARDMSARGRGRTFLLGMQETGAELRVIGVGDRSSRFQPPAVLTGTVRLYPNGPPARGVEVFMSGTDWATRTDSLGRFRLEVEGYGGYRVAVMAAGGRTSRGGVDAWLTRGRETTLDLVLGEAPATRVLLPGPGARSQQGLRGRVVDEEGNPVAGTTLELMDNSSVAHAVADSMGRFELRVPQAAAYVLRARRLGWAEAADTVRVPEGRILSVTVRMVRDPLRLEPLIVVAEAREPELDQVGFYGRSEGLGRFMTLETIEKRRPPRTSDLLGQVSGVFLVPAPDGVRVITRSGLPNARLTGDGICWPRILLDGMVVEPGGQLPIPVPIDQVVNPSDIVGVEVYRSAAEVPPQFGGAQSACGVIVIWTRRGR